MTDLEYLLAYAKQCHDAKDAAEILDVIQDIKKLDYCYQQGNEIAICQVVGEIVDKHQKEADEHDKGLPPSQDIHQLYRSCRGFLVGLGRRKIEKKGQEKIVEEALKHLGGN